MGERVVNENSVAPFDHRTLSLNTGTKPFSHAQNGSYKGTSTAIIYAGSIQTTLRSNVGVPSSSVGGCSILSSIPMSNP